MTSDTSNSNRISGADIIVPESRGLPHPPQAPLAPEAARELDFDELRAMIDACPDDANDRLDAVIVKLITDGITEERAIIRIATKLGFKPGHAANRLTKGAGRGASRYFWRRNNDGSYRLN